MPSGPCSEVCLMAGEGRWEGLVGDFLGPSSVPAVLKQCPQSLLVEISEFRSL